MTATFEIKDQRFQSGNFEPQYKFNEAISLYVNCDNQ